MRRVVLVVAAAALCGCVAASDVRQEPLPPRVTPIPITALMMERIQHGVRSGLKDPNSAMFGNIIAGERIYQGRQEIVVCGFVNAKNSFGGYVGAQPFVAKGLSREGYFQLIAMGGESQYAGLLVAGACSTAGLPLG